MISNFQIYTDKKIIAVVFSGAVVYEDILTWFKELHSHPDFSPEFYCVVDLRKAEFGIERRDQPAKMAKKGKELASYINKISLSLKKWAIIADTPVETSLAMLFAKDTSEKQPMEIFSTTGAAENYLGISLKNIIDD